MQKTIALVVAYEGFQEKEYHETRRVLEAADFKVTTVSDASGFATDHTGLVVPVDVTLDKFQPALCDGFFVIGGPGALEHLDNSVTYRILNEMYALQKPYGAICIAPRILAKAEVLRHKKATCWDADNGTADLFEQHAVTFTKKPVVTDGCVVTADGPQAATEFGKAIIDCMRS